ncbi:MAG: RdgB/HAM1 family non-canonical purine NTP pyrophosphatase [Mogibacterium sp.]|nr:RdgB/HAM1 family non-canonical purine NTP pyrophosphatase [Mogibacterium sp.]
MRTAILASQNKNKIIEISAILNKYGLDVIARDDAGIPTDDIEETGETFEDNSYLKARTIFDMIRENPDLAKYLGSPVIADDSGLMVDALDGAPGVYSARYAGEGCTYADNNVKLLAALEGVPEERRGAEFVTVITLIYPDDIDVPAAAVHEGDVYVLRAIGRLRGKIAAESRGTQGFGYDPVFIPDGYGNTFGELGTDFKNTISHRARALMELERLLG